jgi:ubiquinone biosynthesis protein
VTRWIDPTFSPIPTIREFGNKIIADRAKRDLNPRRLYQLATEGNDLLVALPHRLDLITARMASNEFETKVEVPQLTLMMEALQKVANRVFSGLVIAGLLVASAMLMAYRRVLGTAGFVFAGVLGVWMVLAILWSDRGKDRK